MQEMPAVPYVHEAWRDGFSNPSAEFQRIKIIQSTVRSIPTIKFEPDGVLPQQIKTIWFDGKEHIVTHVNVYRDFDNVQVDTNEDTQLVLPYKETDNHFEKVCELTVKFHVQDDIMEEEEFRTLMQAMQRLASKMNDAPNSYDDIDSSTSDPDPDRRGALPPLNNDLYNGRVIDVVHKENNRTYQMTVKSQKTQGYFDVTIGGKEFHDHYNAVLNDEIPKTFDLYLPFMKKTVKLHRDIGSHRGKTGTVTGWRNIAVSKAHPTERIFYDVLIDEGQKTVSRPGSVMSIV